MPIVTLDRLVQPRNTVAGPVVKVVLRMLMLVRPVHEPNAKPLMLVTLLGTMMLVSPVQEENALLPRVTRFGGSIMLVIPVLLNTPELIVVTVV
jgi:hypothetical protein